jgi:hypothetical protein
MTSSDWVSAVTSQTVAEDKLSAPSTTCLCCTCPLLPLSSQTRYSRAQEFYLLLLELSLLYHGSCSPQSMTNPCDAGCSANRILR